MCSDWKTVKFSWEKGFKCEKLGPHLLGTEFREIVCRGVPAGGWGRLHSGRS